MRRADLRLAAAAVAMSLSLACSSPVANLPQPPQPSDESDDAGPPIAIAAPPSLHPVVLAPGGRHVYHWLKGSTHVHSVHSGDSKAPIDEVFRWYGDRGYDFIFLSDHNRVTRIEPDAARALLVLPAVELTFNPDVCEPEPFRPTGKCRIHVNGLGVTSFPEGKLNWPDRKTDQRVAMYQRAIDTVRELGGAAVLNHPSWHWGIDGAQLVELASRGFRLIEIANQQFPTWNAGDSYHPALDTIWDHALSTGATLWGIATDDAHSFDTPGTYPAGGGWVVVDAAREPTAIRAAIERGAFYASTGVVLARAGVEDGGLVVELDPASRGAHTIRFIGDGRVLFETAERSARFPLVDAPGYVRAEVRGPGGAMAWVQPARP